MSVQSSSASVRRHDLDALRAFAMLLGIVLHVSLSLTGFPWIVRDLDPNPWWGLLVGWIHGFRMPLFILLSGYFTMMIYRKRGVGSLVGARARRVLVPCLLGLVTIIPAMNLAGGWADRRASRRDLERTGGAAPTGLIEAVRVGDSVRLREFLQAGADLTKADAEFKVPPLGWAALEGRREVAEILIEHGARVDIRDGGSYTPLHQASFLGRADLVRLFLDRGADADALGSAQETPYESSRAPLELTRSITEMMRIELPPPRRLEAGREECRQLLAARMKTPPKADGTAATSPSPGIRARYSAFLSSPRFLIRTGEASPPFHLFRTPVFHHLWFLWILWWLVVGFALIAWVAERLRLPRLSGDLALRPIAVPIAIALTLIPQAFMETTGLTFGPDTTVGLLPYPHLLLYYGLFFGFGALYYDAHDRHDRLGRRWAVLLGLSTFVAFPLGLASVVMPVPGGIAQVCFAWCMSIGAIGICRSLLPHEDRRIRYLSDSSYWLYLSHMPLVIVAQAIVRDWPMPSILKFGMMVVAVSTILLASYQLFVRYTWIGRMLNGPVDRRRGAAGAGDETPKHSERSATIERVDAAKVDDPRPATP